MTLNNADKRFSPTYDAGALSPLYGKIRPWLPVRVQATVNGITKDIYTGFLSKLRVNPHLDIQEAYIYCTDGMDLLARNMVTQDVTNRTKMNDGKAVGKILDAAGWPIAKRSIDDEGSSIVDYPLTVEF